MKFSIIIPAHNAAGYIEKALKSIAEQNFKDYELIVVCDACTDNTEEIAKRYGARTVCVDYHRDGLTRNKGLDLAQGEWVLFLDDDDWYLHEFVLSMLAGVAGKNGEDIVLFSFIWRGVGYCRQKADDVAIAVWSKCWRRDFIGDTRFSARPYWSDVDFHNAMMAKRPKAAFWDTPFVYYNYMRSGSISWREHMGEIAGYDANERY